MTSTATTAPQQQQKSIQPAPRSWKDRFRWLGPGITWMAAGAGGAGELLLPPRVGSLYGYTFLWAIVLAVVLKWFINREVGRYSVCTGSSLLQGFKQMPGGNWAVWLIIVPQFVVGMASIAGLASAAATALILILPGSVTLWTAVIVGITSTFLVLGAYSTLEKVATVLAILLALTGIIAAVTVLPSASEIATGFSFDIPADTNYQEILPWLSFVLAGAAGIIWYSYWLPASGYGAGEKDQDDSEPIDPKQLEEDKKQELKGWIKEMNLDISLGVIGGLLIVLAFLILGAELLRPEGLVPEENEVAKVLGQLLGNIWGNFGFWFMVTGVFIGFFATVMTNQDGWGRMLADGTAIVLKPFGWLKGRWADPGFLRKFFIWTILAAGPVGLYMWLGQPVLLVQIAGIIEAVHIPFIVFCTLYLNKTRLPESLQPSWVSFGGAFLAGLFFIGFAGMYLAQQLGWIS